MSMLKQLLDLNATDLLSLTVLGAVVTMIGNLGATLLKDLLLSRSFEKWKSRQSALAVYRRFRDPLLLASIELLTRLREIVYETPVDFLDADLLEGKKPQPSINSADDLYYKRYKLVSTVYRLSAWLGWSELYRRSVTFLDSGNSEANQRLELQVRKIRLDLADGRLNAADDWEAWTDALIFREEQRAIGESMISESGMNPVGVLGYAGFCKAFEVSIGDTDTNWLQTGASFILNLKASKTVKDFRRVRCLRIICHLIDLVDLLDPKRLTGDMKNLRIMAATDLEPYRVGESL